MAAVGWCWECRASGPGLSRSRRLLTSSLGRLRRQHRGIRLASVHRATGALGLGQMCKSLSKRSRNRAGPGAVRAAGSGVFAQDVCAAALALSERAAADERRMSHLVVTRACPRRLWTHTRVDVIRRRQLYQRALYVRGHAAACAAELRRQLSLRHPVGVGKLVEVEASVRA